MCGQMKATHPAGCPSYGVVCSACGLVGHKLVFCRKVIALKKSSTSSSRGQRQPKNKDNKIKRKRIQESSSEDEKPVKKSKKVTIAKEDNMYDSDPHVYMSLADIKETQHDEDSSLPSDSLPNQVSSTVSPTYILEALGAPIPPELVPNPVVQLPPPNFASTIPWPTYPVGSLFNKYEPQPTDGLPVWPLHPEDCWDPVTSHP